MVELTENDLKAVIAEWTGVPIARIGRWTPNAGRMEALADELGRRVIGQQEAIAAVVAVLKRRFVLGETNRPIGGFLFVGPSGVGKTELAKALAESLFTDEAALIRFDMSEYQERHTVSRLIGAPPGYIGHGEGGQLTEAVKQRRFAVVLLDEVEKAHPDVFNLLLQILSDGRLTDASGVTVDFRHTLILLTSNLGNVYSSQLTPRLGLGAWETDRAVEEESDGRITAAVREFFRPELLNRLDGVVRFRRFAFPELVEIGRLELAKLEKRLSGEVRLAPTQAALEAIVRVSQDADANARAVNRTIGREIEPPLIELLSSDEADLAGQRFIDIDCDEDGGFRLKVRTEGVDDVQSV